MHFLLGRRYSRSAFSWYKRGNVVKLKDAKYPIPFHSLEEDQELTRDIQTALKKEGVLRSLVDGFFGSDTQNALVRFKRLRNISGGNVLLATDIIELQRAFASGSTNLITNTQAAAVYGTRLYPSELLDLNNTLDKYHIIEPEQIREFLAQTAHESGGLKWLLELASGDNYEGREDLGNIYPGDGRKFKGSGVLQTTGRANAQKLADVTGDVQIMEKGAQYIAKNYPFMSAGVWWQDNNVNEEISHGANLYQISQLVNTGSIGSGIEPNGLVEREYYYQKAVAAIK